MAALLAVPAHSRGEGEAFRTVQIEARGITVFDGDTFQADLDGNGRIEEPRERVRLLYVDAPELGKSRKGQDRLHGLPALAALRSLLGQGVLRVAVPRIGSQGNYGRTLAVVWAGELEVNLALVEAGHAPLDTRFSFPANYLAYQEAEGRAFSARRGIWGTAASRKKYLKRLKRELRTPASPDNPQYLPGWQRAETISLEPLLGRFIHLEGVIVNIQQYSKKVLRFDLKGGAGKGKTGQRKQPIPVIAYSDRAARLGADVWRIGAHVRVDGFVQNYKGRMLQVLMHYGTRPPLTHNQEK